MSDVLKTNAGSNFNTFLLLVCYLDLSYASFWKDHFLSRIDILDQNSLLEYFLRVGNSKLQIACHLEN